MCGSLKLNEVVPTNVREEFDPKGKVFVQENPPSLDGTVINKPIYWDGWAREEGLQDKWLNQGPWMRAEILASSFNERGRDYEIPMGHAIRAIVMERPDRFVLKIVTREAEGKEIEVRDRFAATTLRRLVPKGG